MYETRALMPRINRSPGAFAARIPSRPALIKAPVAVAKIGGAVCPPGRKCVPCVVFTGVPEVLDHFRLNKAAIEPARHNPQIQSLAQKIVNSQGGSQPIKTVLAAGHTDPVGSDDYNADLSRRRAQSVIGALCTAIEKIQAGVVATLIFQIAPCGEQQQKGTREESRRVEVFLLTTTPAAPTTPPFRPCCMLTKASFGDSEGNILEPGQLGTHGGADEANGLIYSGGGGFLDLGHIRDVCDITKAAFDAINDACGSPTTLRGAEGVAKTRTIPLSMWLPVARAFAYDDALAHEIRSYWINVVGMHNSAFSPEDLFSNFVGTLVAETAIKAGGPFNDEATKAIDALVTTFSGQPKAESVKAFDKISSKWVSFSDFNSIFDNAYLKRRNFTRTPWKVGHSSDVAIPAIGTSGFGTAERFYNYTLTGGGNSIPKSSFPAEIKKIRADAKTKHGNDFDRP